MNQQALPFTREAFLAMFGAYNQAIWPLQVVAYALALIIVILAIRPLVTWSDRLISALLAAFWLWIGGVFFLGYQRVLDRSPISTIAMIGFFLQGLLLLWFGVIRRELRFKAHLDLYGSVALALVAYAALFYPMFSYLDGHFFPASPGFGLGTVPCPTTIFTFGLLLWTSGRVPKAVLVVPTLWALMGGISAPLNYGILEDFGLLLSGVLGTGLLLWRDRRAARGVAEMRTSSLGRAWSAGVHLFWRYVGLWLLVAVAVALVAATVAFVAVIAFAVGAISHSPALGIAVAVVAMIPIVALALLFSIVVALAQRAIAVENVGPIAALGSGWTLMRAHLGDSLITWLINLGLTLGCGIACIAGVVGLVVVLGGIGAVVYAFAGSTAPTIAYLGVGSIVFIAIALTVIGIANAFFWTYWTLAYLRLTGRGSPA